MAKYANVGKSDATLMEECGEVIQIIAKKYRFDGATWDEVPPGKTQTRWEMLKEEMSDLLLAWERMKEEMGEGA